MILPARGDRPGNHTPGKDNPRIAPRTVGRAGNDAVLAGAARSDDEDQRTAPCHGTQANTCRRPMIAKRSFPEIQSIAATAMRIRPTMKATWSKS